MNAIQLEFWPKDPMEELESRMVQCENKSENVRKGIYSKHTQLVKLYNQLQDRLEILERYICKNTL